MNHIKLLAVKKVLILLLKSEVPLDASHKGIGVGPKWKKKMNRTKLRPKLNQTELI